MNELHTGLLAPGFEPVVELVNNMLAADPDWTFQLVVHTDTQTVVDLHAGAGYGTALHLQASATKGVAGLAVAAALQNAGLDVTTPVATLWPEFAAAGKAAVTVAELLSHQVGLLRTTGSFTIAEWGEGGAVAADLAAQRPRWAPGRAHGYHALTIGPLANEIVHRLTGAPLLEFYDQAIRTSGDIDFWVRLPRDQDHRVRDVVLPPPVEPVPAPTGSLTDEATGQLDAMGPQNSWINSRELLVAGVPSVSGAGTARGLADVYAAALGLAGRTALLTEDTLAAVTQLQAAGTDLVLGGESRYAVLFQKPSPTRDFGTAAAFGHDGAGGALAFADPVTRVAFGYVTGRASVPAGADWRALVLAAEVRRIRLRDC